MKESNITTKTSHTESVLDKLPLWPQRQNKQRSQEFAEGELNAYIDVLSFLCSERQEIWERMSFTKAEARQLIFKQIKYLKGKLKNTEQKLEVSELFRRQLSLFDE